MKNRLVVLLASAIVIIAMPFCGKGGGGGTTDPCTSDPKVVISTTPAAGTTEAPAPGPSFPLKVTVSSTIPTSGVTIEVKAHPEGSTSNFFTETKSSTTKDTDFTITGAPSTVICVVDVTVTSKSCNTNKATASYRFSKK